MNRPDIRDLSTVERTALWLDELIAACRRFGPLYTVSPKLAADLTRKAKGLRTSLHTLRTSLDQPRKT